MGVRICVTCDHCLGEPSGATGAGVLTCSFDALEETWGDLVAWLRAAGWRVDLDAQHHAVRVLCPSHAGDVRPP